MKNIFEIMKENGIELSEEQGKKVEEALLENYRTKAEFNKKLKAVEDERDSFQKKYEEAEKAIKGFEGEKDKIKEYETKISDMEKEYQKELEERDRSDAMKKALESVKFTSEHAKNAVLHELEAADLKMVNGELLGLNDMLSQIREKDKTAFVEENEAGKPKFTESMSSHEQGDKSELASIREAFGLPAEGSKK